MNTHTGSRQEQIMTLLLNASSGLSIDDMAAKLDISRNAVKQHLVVLEKQQLVKEGILTSTGGRPARCYALTEQGVNHFPKQYAWFCNLLLNDLAAEMTPESLEKMMWNMGVKLANSLAPQFGHKNTQQKLEALVELMQSLGYHAELEQQEGGQSIKAVNCVYHDLAQQHPALCHFDQALITTLLEKPVEQISCMAKKDCACRFNIARSSA
ncbi:helix-turn-helix transcriptional regulator [Methylomonas rapida]|uniref:Methanogen output domain 1-containing protein n=1 Tax=Methylomonas rapida TaxID=2963939 RepID=A0ABY7GJ46_9GAMM|nr:methanogen output domain 1-containing protein [Methylomonas rapida]WAR44365.1 methanogen output domain 1-containing protein [Methylomonas rapida]